jgi:dihydrofolate reductase
VIAYAMNVSADGYCADAEGKFDWSEPAEDVFAFWIERQRDTVLDVYGRAMYETMRYWEAPPEGSSKADLEFADAWQKTPRIVVSSTLESAERARLVRDPSHVPGAEGIVHVSGPKLAAAMIDRIDEFWTVVYPVAVGGGVPFFPAGVRLNLKLLESRRFDSGPVLLRYQRA